VHGVILGFDVDVARAPLDGGVNRRVHQLDDRVDVARQPLDGEVVVPRVVVFEKLEMKRLSRFLEDALGALALLEDRFNRRAGADRHLDRGRQDDGQLVNHR
jgi:hypothetical protein